MDFLHYLRTYLQGGCGEKRTGAYRGERSKMAIFLRTYFMDDPKVFFVLYYSIFPLRVGLSICRFTENPILAFPYP